MMDKNGLLLYALIYMFSRKYCLGSPHVVFMLADDLGWGDVGFHNPDVVTPHLDRLAAEGVTLTNVYTQPVCGPSRHAFLTGRYPFRDGLQHDSIYGYQPVCSPLDLTLLPVELLKTGYATHMIGKWHMGFCHEDCLPTSRGFQSFYGYLSDASSYYTHHSSFEGGYDFYENKTLTQFAHEDEYITHEQVQRAVDILEKHNPNQPLFLYIAFTAPHIPLQVPNSESNFYQQSHFDPLRRKYLTMVTALDVGVGRVLDTLERTGLVDDTLVVFMSDNGGNTLCASNQPYRGGKGSIWEGGTKSPTVVYGGVLEKRAYQHHGLFHMVDWYKTILGVAGAEGSVSTVIDSLNQWDMIRSGAPSMREEMIYNLDVHPFLGPLTGYAAIRNSRYKLIQGSPGGETGWTLIEQECEPLGDCDVIKESFLHGNQLFYDIPEKVETGLEYITVNASELMLFDLLADPYETTDLKCVLPDVVDELLTRLEFYMNEVARPLWPEPEPNSSPDLHNGTITTGWCSTEFLKIQRLESLIHKFRPGWSSRSDTLKSCP